MNKRWMLSTMLGLAGLGGCSPDGVQDAGRVPGRATISSPPSTAAVPATTSAAAPVATRATTPPTPTTTAPPVLPAAWKTCTSRARGYSIDYPGTWYTDAPGRSECRYFDPEPVEYTPNSDGFMFSLMLGGDNRPFEEARRPTLSDADSRTLIHEEITVGGRRAVRFELITGGGGLLPGGSRLYGYSVEREGIAFGVTTYWFPDQPEAHYRERKGVVDRAVTTLRFL